MPIWLSKELRSAPSTTWSLHTSPSPFLSGALRGMTSSSCDIRLTRNPSISDPATTYATFSRFFSAFLFCIVVDPGGLPLATLWLHGTLSIRNLGADRASTARFIFPRYRPRWGFPELPGAIQSTPRHAQGSPAMEAGPEGVRLLLPRRRHIPPANLRRQVGTSVTWFFGRSAANVALF